MHQKPAAWVTIAVITFAVSPLQTAWPPLSLPSASPLQVYRGNHAFIHDIGARHPYGWEAYYREHRPGYFIKGLRNGGERLTEGTYRYDFYFALRPGHLT